VCSSDLEDVILQAFTKSLPQSKAVVIEKKGVRSLQRRLIRDVALRHGLEVVEV